MTRDPLERLSAHVKAKEDALLGREDADEFARERVARHVLARRRRAPRWEIRLQAARRGLLVLVSSALLVLGALALYRWSARSDGPAALTFTVAGRDGVVHAWESAPDDAGLSMIFSDGSSFSLAPGARIKVVDVSADGANVLIESGHVAVEVVPRARREAAWSVRTGPFSVAVKGTRFDVDWDSIAEKFSLRLFEGKVSVSGCGFETEVPAGHRVESTCRRPGFDLARLEESEGRSEAPATPAPRVAAPPLAASEEAALADSARAAGVEAPSSSARAESRPSWRQLARAGHFDRAYAAAMHTGFELEGARAALEDVLLLADSARHTGHSVQARRAYETVRRRGPGTPSAAAAAFALGLLSIEASPENAVHWFETSLAEHPSGPLAQAARDRLFEIAVRGGDGLRLQRAAKAYLAGSPRGPHAARARALLLEQEFFDDTGGKGN
jgi:hypothetical protein